MKMIRQFVALATFTMPVFVAYAGCTITESKNGVIILENGTYHLNKSVDGISVAPDGTIIYYSDQIYARSAGNINDPLGQTYLQLLLQALNNRDLSIWIGYPKGYQNCEGISQPDNMLDKAKPLYLRIHHMRP